MSRTVARGLSCARFGVHAKRSLRAIAIVVAGAPALGAGCLDRPATANNPTTQTNFTSVVHQSAVEKVDLLFDIDNSASMGDKQAYLEQAVPDLITRLVSPNCIDDVTHLSKGSSVMGACPAGTTIEFPPVHDMHLGVISSSLGSRGGDMCDPTVPAQAYTNYDNPFLDGAKAIPTHVDDRGELIARGATGAFPSNAEHEAPVGDTGGQNFLDWFPTGAGWSVNDGKTATGGAPEATSPVAVALGDPGTLENDFQQIVTGVHEYGCGIESQLESWYRFLVQPDPYGAIGVPASGPRKGLATWEGVDATIIKQRHDFLRPDSLVAIIVLSDENDSEIDVRSLGGTAYAFMESWYPLSRATAICQTDPNSPDCMSCLENNAYTKADPSCRTNGGVYPKEALEDWGHDPNLRHVKMKQKYGIVPQYPLQRYVLGLTNPTVPDRDHEYPLGAGSYQGGTNGDSQDLDCTNPLFAASLPDGSDLSAEALCNVKGGSGPRTNDMVFFAHIGGVPHQLLQVDPTNPGSPQKDTLTDADWEKILGRNPDAYDYTGIDPHMVEDYQPRQDVVAGPALPAGLGPDPISGRDWITNTGPASEGGNSAVSTTTHVDLRVDREYACVFELAVPRDCSNTKDFVDESACDCSSTGLPPEAISPLCSQAPSGQYTLQRYAKAYPTVRELSLARKMGPQGIISSLCPIHTAMEGVDDQVYGYRPAVSAIVGRLKTALSAECVPKLSPNPAGIVDCAVLATLNGNKDSEEVACNRADLGLSVPDPSVLGPFQKKLHEDWVSAGSQGVDLSTLPTCAVKQIPYSAGATCAKDTSQAGWCYVTGAPAGQCSQEIQFTQGSPPDGATVSLQCIAAQWGP